MDPETNLLSAYEKLYSGRLRERTEGLTQLKHIITHGDNARTLNDKAYLKMFGAIFRATDEEKRAIKSKSITAAVSNRISTCGNVLRAAVEAGARYMEAKSVRALFEHTVAHLSPDMRKELVDLLRLDYVKCIRIVLEYPPHREHLSPGDWQALMEFCCNYVSDEFKEDPRKSPLPSNGRTDSPSVSRSTSSLRSVIHSQARLRSDTEEVIMCIHLLLLSPNAAISGFGEAIGSTLIKFLTAHRNITRAHHPALSAFAHLFQYLIGNDINQTSQFCEDILPIVARMWSSKLPNIREQLILILTFITPHIKKDLKKPTSTHLRGLLDQLIEIMLEDIRSRHDRDCLMMEDVEFEYDEGASSPSHPLSLGLLRLKETVNTKKELLWAVPMTLGNLMNLLDTNQMQVDGSQGQHEYTGKRRRISQYFDEIVRGLRSETSTSALPLLQLIPFILNGRKVARDKINAILTHLLRLCSNDDRVLAAWAMISISCCGTKTFTSSRDEKLETLWMEAWKIGLRNITSATTSRASCHMLYVIMVQELVPFTSVADDVENILTQPELNGPMNLGDSSFAFLRVVMHRRSVIAYSSTVVPGEKLLQWIISKWKPGETLNRASAPAFCNSVQASCMIRFLLSACSSPINLQRPNVYRICGDIGQAVLAVEKNRDLLKLFLLEDKEPANEVVCGFSDLLKDAAPSISNNTVEKRMLSFFDRSRSELRERWSEALSNPQFITVEMVYNYALFLLVSTFMTSIFDGDEEKGERLTFHHKCLEMAADLELFLKSPDARNGHIDSVLRVTAFALPQVSSIVQNTCEPQSAFYGFFGRILQIIATSVTERLAVKEEEEDGNEMDIDIDFDGDINERKKDKELDILLERTAIQAVSSETAFRAHSTSLLFLLANSVSQPPMARLGSDFMRYLDSIPAERVVLSRSLIRDFFSFATDCKPGETSELLQKFASSVLQTYSLERCEPGVLLCIDCISAIVGRWTRISSNEDLRLTCESIYEWLIKVALGKHIASPTVRIAIANLLQAMMDVRIDYGNNSELKSARTNFITLLEDEDFHVQFHMANIIPHIFELVAVNLHFDVYKDVHKHLPKQEDSIESLAIRLFALSRISTESLTTRKALVYHMFETGQFEIARGYAMRSLGTLAENFGLQNSQQLLRLYSPQIIFTWLTNFSLFQFPFYIAGYKTIREFCNEHTEEIVGQLMATYNDDVAREVAKTLGVGYKEILILSFHKVMAYGFCADSKFAGREDAGSPIQTRMRDALGDDKLREMLQLEHPRIFGVLFESMDPENLFEKLFTKFPADLLHARTIMEQIASISHSEVNYTDFLKPSFASHAANATINYISKGMGHDPSTIWTPSLFTFVARKLINTINPALGRIHAATVIRKLRLLISMAGPVLQDGYPLEMMLHGLTPFITDNFCAEDTIGIVQYLLINGATYLAKRPGFTAGTFLSMLTILKTFLLGGSQSSTEQSQYESSQSRAQSFRTWLEDFVMNYRSTVLNDAQNAVLHQILQSALGFKSPGNAHKGTQEGQLLKLILQDESSSARLLDDVSKKMTFKLLARNFARPQSFREDVLGADTDSVALSKVLFKICRSYEMSEGFLMWCGRVFGRAFAASGAIHKDWTREADVLPRSNFNYKVYGIDCMSRARIYNHLADILVSDDRKQVGLAEMTLIKIIHRDTTTEGNTLADLALPEQLLKALQWRINPLENEDEIPEKMSLEEAGKFEDLDYEAWVTRLAKAISTNMELDPIGGRLSDILQDVPTLAEKLFQYMVHICLCCSNKDVKKDLSSTFKQCISQCTEKTIKHVSVLIKTVIYLRTQPVAEEKTELQRDEWLDLDFLELSIAASTCKLYKTALLFAEIHSSQMQSNYTVIPTDLLIDIYKNIDEPDSFYGVTQDPNLDTSLMKFEYEGENWKSLSFRGARLESSMKAETGPYDTSGLVNSFNGLGLSGLSHIFQHNHSAARQSQEEQDRVFQSAWKLEKWDLPCPPKLKSESAILYRALQTVNNSLDTSSIPTHLDDSYLDVMRDLTQSKQTAHGLATNMRTLAMLTEVEEILTSSGEDDLMDTAERLGDREKWMHTESFDKVDRIISARQAAFSSLAKQPHLRATVSLNEKTAILMEAKALMGVCKMARSHKALQHSLTTTMQLEKLQNRAANVDLKMQDIVSIQVANVLWDQGEAPSAIRLLQNLVNAHSSSSQDITISKAKMLSKLGVWISEARSLKPDLIIDDYLDKAVKALNKDSDRDEVGRVFHEFAVFCDGQLNDQGNREDFERIKKIRDAKQVEHQEIQKLFRASKDKQEKRLIGKHMDRAGKHLNLDNLEYERLEKNRQNFLERSLTSYLHCLANSDRYESDAIRFCALWLEHYTNEAANIAIESLMSRVSARKFVPMINQLSSRLSSDSGVFSKIIFNIVYRICRDHPYHGMYQLFSLTRAQVTDPAAQSRHESATNLSLRLRQEKAPSIAARVYENLLKATKTFIHISGISYDRARRMHGKQTMQSCDFPREVQRFLSRDIQTLQIPPPTLNISVRIDNDYSKLPYIEKFSNEVSIASGLSAPKIMTCVSSDGKLRKMLMKGSDNDDLRQDAIMEQVFEQVSGLLQRSRNTRQRNLTVRTYKVIPLTVSSGIIEFVADTMPLHDYLMPAHTKYRPRDWKQSYCRKIISDVDKGPREDRLAVYQNVTRNFKPVMRYFFMHNFDGPDNWFAARTAYSRSTATNSMLGYVLGLGDRHGHNILLDQTSGEIVHIDLGVAFEQGRILPIPEVVPFRLTRDVVDGMGITKTEGVFRRCCEFTLSLLRDEAHNILTILDVLRYDPLYNWTISPLRMQRMQEAKEDDRTDTDVNTDANIIEKTGAAKKEANEESEAERALLVVSKKLSKTLSVGATVSELIREATDERNLALLFSGWAAYI